ncbi:hypothetical protein [Leptolyngbya sp. CCY15150]|nr:hypothetical protein [Leptolyngbya sp. CCY15150]
MHATSLTMMQPSTAQAYQYHRLGVLHDHGLGDWCISARHREFGTLNVME